MNICPIYLKIGKLYDISSIKNVVTSGTFKSNSVPNNVNQKINKRKKLPKADKKRNCTTNAPMIRSLNREIMDYFKGKKVNKVTQLSTGPR